MASPNEVKLYWNKNSRCFFGKYKWLGAWKNKAVPVCISDRDEATRWFRRWLEELEARGVEPVNGEVVLREPRTVRGLGDRWLDWKRAECGTDTKAYSGCERLLRLWVLPHSIADLDIEHDLTIGACTTWIEWVKAKRRAALTTRNIVQGLRGFLVDVRGKGWITLRENPMHDPFIRKMLRGVETVAGKNTIVHLKGDEVARLLACNSELVPACRRVRTLFAIGSGCRMGEIAALRWSDLHLDGQPPVAQVFRQLQKSGSRVGNVFKDPKKRSHRVLPLHPAVVAALRAWHDDGWRIHVGRDPVPEDPVFPAPDGAYSVNRWADLLRSDLAIAGLPVLFDGKHPYTFHALRRTFMSLLDAAGVPRELISALAGHSGKSVTDRHYIAKNIDRFYQAVSVLPLSAETATVSARSRAAA